MGSKRSISESLKRISLDDSLLRDWCSLDDGNPVIRSHLDYLPIGKLNIQLWIDSITQEMDETVHSISKGGFRQY